jgi:hypothetical protein
MRNTDISCSTTNHPWFLLLENRKKSKRSWLKRKTAIHIEIVLLAVKNIAIGRIAIKKRNESEAKNPRPGAFSVKS